MCLHRVGDPDLAAGGQHTRRHCGCRFDCLVALNGTEEPTGSAVILRNALQSSLLPAAEELSPLLPREVGRASSSAESVEASAGSAGVDGEASVASLS